jgi:hypothetical protein
MVVVVVVVAAVGEKIIEKESDGTVIWTKWGRSRHPQQPTPIIEKPAKNLNQNKKP